MRGESYLLPIKQNPLIRRALRRALRHHVAERRLGSTSLRVRFPAGQHLGLYFAPRIHYEPEITRRLGEWVPRGGVAFDVGANLGLYALLLSDHVGPEGSVFAFEPDPQNLPWLRQNIELNGLSNLEVCPCALGEHPGELTLYQDVTTTRTSSLLPDAWQPDPDARRTTPVRVETLNDYAHRIGRLDFVKIDTEGFEVAVLRGGLELFRRFSPTLLVEVAAVNRHEVEEMLTSLGYRFRDPATQESLGSWQWPSNVLCSPR